MLVERLYKNVDILAKHVEDAVFNILNFLHLLVFLFRAIILSDVLINGLLLFICVALFSCLLDAVMMDDGGLRIILKPLMSDSFQKI